MSKPRRAEVRPYAYMWIMCESHAHGCYSSDDLKDHLAAVFKADRSIRLANGRAAFDNVVEWVTAEMTEDRWHEPCGGDSKRRRLTALGWTMLREEMAEWLSHTRRLDRAA